MGDSLCSVNRDCPGDGFAPVLFDEADRAFFNVTWCFPAGWDFGHVPAREGGGEDGGGGRRNSRTSIGTSHVFEKEGAVFVLRFDIRAACEIQKFPVKIRGAFTPFFLNEICSASRSRSARLTPTCPSTMSLARRAVRDYSMSDCVTVMLNAYVRSTCEVC